MNERKTNVVISMLHSFVLKEARKKALDMIADAQYHNHETLQEEEYMDIDSIKMSVKEYLLALEDIPSTSKDIELVVYRGQRDERNLT